MMDVLTRHLLKWQQEYGKFGERWRVLALSITSQAHSCFTIARRAALFEIILSSIPTIPYFTTYVARLTGRTCIIWLYVASRTTYTTRDIRFGVFISTLFCLQCGDYSISTTYTPFARCLILLALFRSFSALFPFYENMIGWLIALIPLTYQQTRYNAAFIVFGWINSLPIQSLKITNLSHLSYLILHN